MAYPQTLERRPPPVAFASHRQERWRETPRRHTVCPFYLFFTSFYLILLQQLTVKEEKALIILISLRPTEPWGPKLPFPAIVNLLY